MNKNKKGRKTLLCIIMASAYYCLATILAACGRQDYPRVLHTIDSLTITCPQKALSMVDSIMKHSGIYSEDEQKYILLLHQIAKCKSYIHPTSADTINSLVEYYENKGDKGLLAKAYYYAGDIHTDLNNIQRAFELFEKTIATLDKTSDNLYLKSKAYSQMGYLSEYRYLYDDAILYYNKSNDISKLIKDTTNQIYNYRDIGTCLILKGKNDSAFMFFRKAHQMAFSSHNTRLYSDVSGKIANYFLTINEIDSASKYIQIPQKQKDKQDRPVTLFIASGIFEKRNQKDSALMCYEEMIKEKNISCRQYGAKKLSNYYLGINNMENAYKYLQIYEQITDSVNKIESAEAIIKVKAMYEFDKNEKERMFLRKENKDNAIIIACLTALILISLTTGIVILRQTKKKKALLAIKLSYERNIHQAEVERLKTNEQKYKEENKKLNENIEEQKKIIELYNERNSELTANENKLSQLLKSDVYAKFEKAYTKGNKKITITDADWLDLEKLVNTVYPDFTTRLYLIYKMNNQDYHICLLLKLNFSIKRISELTFHSHESISSSRRRLYMYAFGKKGTPADWDAVISSL